MLAPLGAMIASCPPPVEMLTLTEAGRLGLT